MIPRKLGNNQPMGLLNGLHLLLWLIVLANFAQFPSQVQAITWTSALCDSYSSSNNTYVDAYYEADSDRCAIFVRFPKIPFNNITAMCNRIANPINGSCQIVNTFNKELAKYLNQSLFAPNDVFFTGLTREPNCGPWEWLRYDGTTTPQPMDANATTCNDTNSVYQNGGTHPSDAEIYMNTTGFLCQCYRPLKSPTQGPPTGNATVTMAPQTGNATDIPSGNFTDTPGNSTGNSNSTDPGNGTVVVGNVTQASPPATTPRSAGSLGPQWIILIGTLLFTLVHPTRRFNLLKF